MRSSWHTPRIPWTPGPCAVVPYPPPRIPWAPWIPWTPGAPGPPGPSLHAPSAGPFGQPTPGPPGRPAHVVNAPSFSAPADAGPTGSAACQPPGLVKKGRKRKGKKGGEREVCVATPPHPAPPPLPSPNTHRHAHYSDGLGTRGGSLLRTQFTPPCTCPEVGGPKFDNFSTIFGLCGPVSHSIYF